jgi:beta-N-acetylhexosaminidase
MVMAGHVAVPSITGDDDLPASLARQIVTDLLRHELAFDGLAITDALDMRAVAQGAAQVVDVITAVRAGEDLLLGTADEDLIARMSEGVAQAQKRGLLERGSARVVVNRLSALRAWLSGFEQPALEVVGCAEHEALARELAERSITLVRNDDALLPLRLPGDARVAVVQAAPARLTPADTSDRVPPTLAAAIRRRAAHTDEFVTSVDPTSAEIAALRDKVAGYDAVICATAVANLRAEQAALGRAMVEANSRTVLIAARTPWDIMAVPEARTYVCSYGALPPTTEALAAALFGEIPFGGHLPVEIRGMYPRGHGLAA